MCSLSGGRVGDGVSILRVQSQDFPCPVRYDIPIALSYRFFCLIKKTVDLPLYTLTDHDGR